MHTLLTQIPGIAEEKIKIDLEKHSTSVIIVASDTTIPRREAEQYRYLMKTRVISNLLILTVLSKFVIKK
jgi:HSP20 family molecular chaperone IbpA